MSRLTKEQIREKLQTIVGNMNAEGVNPTQAINDIIAITDSFESLNEELTLANASVTDLTSQLETRTSELGEAQKTNLALLKRVNISDTMESSHEDSVEQTTIASLLADE